MSETVLPPLDDCGFVRVPSPAKTPLWMTCNACGKSDHFFMAEGQVRCRCGARYDHAVRPDDTKVPFDELTFVPFDQGPKRLADLEWDPQRVGILVAVVLGIGFFLAFSLYWLL